MAIFSKVFRKGKGLFVVDFLYMFSRMCMTMLLTPNFSIHVFIDIHTYHTQSHISSLHFGCTVIIHYLVNNMY